MKLTDLKEAVQEIAFDEGRQEQMVTALQRMKRPGRYSSVWRIAASFAVCILAIGLLRMPVRALVDSLVQERMEELPKEEVEDIGEQIQNQQAEADSYTRAYTEEEEKRRGKLYAQYLDGVFPKGELPRVDSEAEAAEYEFCFLNTTGLYYLPEDRALTDEEILEQIDFEQKRDYALREQNAEEIAEREAAEQEQIKEVVASGGITEEEAIEAARGYLKQIFGLDGDGMELNHYLQDPDSAAEDQAGAYCVNWSDRGNHSYYYFFIDATDGTIRSFTYSHDMRKRLETRPAITEAPGMIPHIEEQAQNFLTEKMGMQEIYEDVTSYYLANEDSGKVSGIVDVLFIKADGVARQISCTWDGQVFAYFVTEQGTYEEELQSYADVTAMRHTEEEGHEVKVGVVRIK